MAGLQPARCLPLSAPRAAIDVDGVVGTERARAIDDGDLAALHERLKALAQLVDDLLLAGLAGGEVERGLVGHHAELLGSGNRAVDGRRLQHVLGGDAPAVQARPSNLLALDDRDRKPRRSAIQGRAVARRPATDHNQIELVSDGNSPPSASLLAALTFDLRPPA
jgi:hypothetical protein